MTRRRWIAEQWNDTTARITGSQAEHMVRVLRAQVGMQADIAAGGRVFHAAATAIAPTEVLFELLSEFQADAALPVTLVLAIYKYDRMEWAIEKATELGVAAIVPAISRRTEKHLALSAGKRVERWRRIAHEAAQQSRRSDVPAVADPVSLAEHIPTASQAVRIVLAEQERAITLRSILEASLADQANDLPAFELAIGPEGGWAPEEDQLFTTNQWRAASLGPRILRAETAAITALAVVASLLE